MTTHKKEAHTFRELYKTSRFYDERVWHNSALHFAEEAFAAALASRAPESPAGEQLEKLRALNRRATEFQGNNTFQMEFQLACVNWVRYLLARSPEAKEPGK